MPIRPTPMIATLSLFSMLKALDADHRQPQVPEEDEYGRITPQYLRTPDGPHQPAEPQFPPDRRHHFLVAGVPVEHRADRDDQPGVEPVTMAVRPFFLL